MLCLGKLITWSYENGFRLRGKQLERTVEQAMANAASGAGIAHSLHLLDLAIDIEVFKDGVMAKTVDEFRPVGEHWKTIDPLCCWGGDFTTRPDANHFSSTRDGIK